MNLTASLFTRSTRMRDVVLGDVVGDGFVGLRARCRPGGRGRRRNRRRCAYDVDVDVDVEVLLSEPQPTSAKLNATVMVATAEYFIYCISQKLGRYQRQPCRNETSRSRPGTLLAGLGRYWRRRPQACPTFSNPCRNTHGNARLCSKRQLCGHEGPSSRW
jgi:hypothetical protein